jgi:hypothetical protein
VSPDAPRFHRVQVAWFVLVAWFAWVSFPFRHPRMWWYFCRFHLAMRLGLSMPPPPAWMKLRRLQA